MNAVNAPSPAPVVGDRHGQRQRLARHARGRPRPRGVRHPLRGRRRLGAPDARGDDRLRPGRRGTRACGSSSRAPGEPRTCPACSRRSRRCRSSACQCRCKYLDGMDSLLSIVQMPAGVPVATVSIGGARNAGLLAARILGSGTDDLAARRPRADGRLPGRPARPGARQGCVAARAGRARPVRLSAADRVSAAWGAAVRRRATQCCVGWSSDVGGLRQCCVGWSSDVGDSEKDGGPAVALVSRSRRRRRHRAGPGGTRSSGTCP